VRICARARAGLRGGSDAQGCAAGEERSPAVKGWRRTRYARCHLLAASFVLGNGAQGCGVMVLCNAQTLHPEAKCGGWQSQRESRSTFRRLIPLSCASTKPRTAVSWRSLCVLRENADRAEWHRGHWPPEVGQALGLRDDKDRSGIFPRPPPRPNP